MVLTWKSHMTTSNYCLPYIIFKSLSDALLSLVFFFLSPAISLTSYFMTSLGSLGENALGFFRLTICNFSGPICEVRTAVHSWHIWSKRCRNQIHSEYVVLDSLCITDWKNMHGVEGGGRPGWACLDELLWRVFESKKNIKYQEMDKKWYSDWKCNNAMVIECRMRKVVLAADTWDTHLLYIGV